MVTDRTDTDDYRLNRRNVLTAVGAGAGTLAGLSAFSGTAVAWDRFDVCFRKCSEVWMIVSETDIKYDPPAVADVIVATGSGLECRTVEFTAANATTMPAQFGHSPVVKYTVPDGEKIVGVLEYNYSPTEGERFDDPVWCVHANRNECATYCEDGKVEYNNDLSNAPCVPDSYDASYADSSNVCPPSTICPDGGGTIRQCDGGDTGGDTDGGTDGDGGGDTNNDCSDVDYTYGTGETVMCEQNCNGDGGGEDENEDENENEGGSGDDYTYTYTYDYTYTKGDYVLDYSYEYVWSEDANQDPDPPTPTLDRSLPCSADGADIAPNPDPNPNPP